MDENRQRPAPQVCPGHLVFGSVSEETSHFCLSEKNFECQNLHSTTANTWKPLKIKPPKQCGERGEAVKHARSTAGKPRWFLFYRGCVPARTFLNTTQLHLNTQPDRQHQGLSSEPAPAWTLLRCGDGADAAIPSLTLS